MLQFFDGFDNYTTLSQKGWSLPGSIQAGEGRNSTQGFREAFGGSGDEGGRVLTTPSDTVILGFAYKTPAYGKVLWNFYGGSTMHVNFGLNASGFPYSTRGGSTIIGLYETAYGINTYRYIEFKLYCHASAGSIEMRIDNEPVIVESGIDTRFGTGDTNITQVTFTHGFSDVSTANMDDFYLCDGTGSEHNTFLGDVSVQTLYPNGNGNSSQLTGSDGNSTDNYLLVDEAGAPSTADYVESSTVGQKDTYAFGNLTATTGTVYAVRQSSYAAKTDAGVRSIYNVARLSTTEEDSDEHFLGTGYAFHSDIWTEKPGGGSWTISDVNSAEFGVKIAA